MADDAISEQQLYDLILSRISEAGAEELANQTMEVVRRGTVIQVDEENGEGKTEGKTKALRPMQPREALAVALESLITALQVPLMINNARNTFNCEKIVWQADGPPEIVERIAAQTIADEGKLPFVEESAKRSDIRENTSDVSLRQPSQPPDVEHLPLIPIPLDFDLVKLEGALKKVVDLKQELHLRFPEVV